MSKGEVFGPIQRLTIEQLSDKLLYFSFFDAYSETYSQGSNLEFLARLVVHDSDCIFLVLSRATVV